MTDVHAAPRGHENSLMFDGVAPVAEPAPRGDAAMLDAFGAPAPSATSEPVHGLAPSAAPEPVPSAEPEPVPSQLFAAPAAPGAWASGAFAMVGGAGEVCGPDGCA